MEKKSEKQTNVSTFVSHADAMEDGLTLWKKVRRYRNGKKQICEQNSVKLTQKNRIEQKE